MNQASLEIASHYSTSSTVQSSGWITRKICYHEMITSIAKKSSATKAYMYTLLFSFYLCFMFW